jgi:catechol 2,3-dioxygenase-like lactoylglutathione lyase family enzyme
MSVCGLDHVNIVTADLAGTKQFYKDLLGLTDGDTSALPAGVEAHWLADPTGRSIIHLQRFDPARHGAGRSSGPTGSIDHVALDCTNYDGVRARCEALGVPYREGLVSPHFSQLFVTDPNDVVLELNFRS